MIGDLTKYPEVTTTRLRENMGKAKIANTVSRCTWIVHHSYRGDDYFLELPLTWFNLSDGAIRDMVNDFLRSIKDGAYVFI